MQPNLRLIHSLTAPGGLLALRHLPRPLSLHTRHFTRPPNRFSTHVVSPPPKITQNSMHFSSSEDSLFSPPPKFLSPARPVLQHTRCWGSLSCLCRQLAERSLSALQVSSPSTALFLQTKSQHDQHHHRPQTCLNSCSSVGSIRPVRSPSPLSSLPLHWPQTSVLQRLDRKLQSAVIVLPPG